MKQKRIKLLSLFSGIGAFEKALTNLNIDYEVVNYCEIDKYASKAYCLIHNEDENKNLWDITKVNVKKLSEFDLMTYGFPCQSFSLVGKRLGLKDTKRGNLFFDAMRITREKKPKYMIAENVKGLLSDDNGKTMELIISTLDNLGYNNYFKVLNAKDYGIPQNRERIFIVSIRKDIDNLSFEFPKKQELKLKLQDIIENNYAPNTRGNKQSKVKIVSYPLKFLGRNQKKFPEDYSMCVDPTNTIGIKINEQIRKLTTKECFRLMGFTDKDHDKLESISNTQKYKQAGNSIVVQVLMSILKNLFLSDNKKKWIF